VDDDGRGDGEGRSGPHALFDLHESTLWGADMLEEDTQKVASPDLEVAGGVRLPADTDPLSALADDDVPALALIATGE